MKTQIIYENQTVSQPEEKIHTDFRTWIQVILVSVILGPVIGVKDTFVCFRRFLLAQKIRSHDDSVFAQDKAVTLLKDVEDHSLEMLISGIVVFLTWIVMYAGFNALCSELPFMKAYLYISLIMIAEGFMFIYLVQSDE